MAEEDPGLARAREKFGQPGAAAVRYWRWTSGGPGWRYAVGIGGPLLALLIFVAVAVGGGEEPSGQTRAPSTSSTPSADLVAQLTAVAGATSVPTSPPAPTATLMAAAPTQSPTPAPLAPQIDKSYRDNRGFMTRASVDDLKVDYLAGTNALVTIDITPKALANEGDTITVTGASAIVASRAIWTTYPEVKEVLVIIRSDFTDANGNTTRQLAAAITVLRATGEKFNYEGLRDRALTDNKLFFCTADKYQIHPAIYRALLDKGCLAQWGQTKG